MPSKLVLCVIDAMAPAMLGARSWRAERRCLGELMQRGLYVPDCVSAFPSVTPVCAASIVTGRRAGRAPHPGDELVPPPGGALCRIRLELQVCAALRHCAAADRHRLQHEQGAPGGPARDDLRASRRRGHSHSGHDLSACTAAVPPRAPARGGAGQDRLQHADAPPSDGPARALLRRRLRQPSHALPLESRDAQACATATRAA